MKESLVRLKIFQGALAPEPQRTEMGGCGIKLMKEKSGMEREAPYMTLDLRWGQAHQ